MPRVSTIDEKSEAPVITYVHEKQSNTRVQLDAIDDIRDHRGRVIEKGSTLRADFRAGLFSTNKPEYISKLEESIAYRTGRIERQEVLHQRAEDKMLDGMLEAVKRNPELAKKLRSRLTSIQIKAKKDQAEQNLATPVSTKPHPVAIHRDIAPAEEADMADDDSAIDLYAEE